ncbi:MAG: glycosyltransferase family 4 protein [Longimicrobiales bacterium]
MRIALIVPGGVDRSGTRRVMPMILALLERLARNHDVHVFALFQEPEPSSYPLLGATVHNIGRGRTAPRAFVTIAREHRHQRFAVLHAIWASPSGVLGAAVSRVFRLPLLVHLLGGELVSMPDIGYGESRTRSGRMRVRFALATARRITAQSAPIVALAQAAGFTAERVPLGIDRTVWPALPPRPRDRSQFARLVHVASLNAIKDQETLLRAMVVLRNNGIAYTLDIVGEDTLNGRVQARARELGLDGINFHGFVEQKALRPLVEKAHLLVMTSRHEAGPAVLMEAALAGVPTVGTRVGQIAEWAPAAAVAVEPGDPAGLAGAITQMLADETRRMDVAVLAGRRASVEDADWTAHHVQRIYHEMVRR